MKRKSEDFKSNPKYEEKTKNPSALMSDSKLIPRVKQYLETHKDKAVISVSSMADALQGMYRDYSRKKKIPFRILVETAYQKICANKSREVAAATDLESQHLEKRRKRGNATSDDSSSDSEELSDYSDDSFSPDNSAYADYQDKNTMNSFLSDMYNKKPQLQNAESSEKTTVKRKQGHLKGTVSASVSASAPGSPRKSDSSAVKHLSSASCPNSPRAKLKHDSGAQGQMFMVDTQGSRHDRRKLGPECTYAEGQTMQGRDVTSRRERSGWSSSNQSPRRRQRAGADMTAISEEEAVIDLDQDVIDLTANTAQTVTPSAKVKTPTLAATPSERVKTEGSSKENTDSATPGTEKKRKPESMDGKGTKKVRKKETDSETKKTPAVQKSTIKFCHIGGNDRTLMEVCKLLVHMKHPEVYQQLGVTPPRGFLLHGPPGCGKTLLANAIAGELDLPFIKMASTEIVSGVSGESEEKLRDVFDRAIACAPCVVFLDEIDAITPKRETASKDMERRIVSQLLTCMDDLSSRTEAHVLVIGATNRPDSLDPALRRAGRFDREICLGIPDEHARKRILQVLCQSLKLEAGFDFQRLARSTPGYVGADLMALAREAAINAVSRVFNELQKTSEEVVQGPPRADDKAEAIPHMNQPLVPASVIEASIAQQTSPAQTAPDGVQTDITVDVPTDITSDCTTSTTATLVPSEHKAPDSGGVHCADIATGLPEADVITSQLEVPSVLLMEDQADCDVKEALPAQNEPETTVAVPSKEDSVTLEFQTVLSWLKEQPPLTSEQLQTLYIMMDDFTAALGVVQPSAKREGFATIPGVTWDDIGALRDVREELQMAILAPVRHPEQFKALGLTNPPGILLAGPPGCGKTLLAKAVANESGINFISVKGPELLNMYVGESERAVRQVFQRARNSSPCVIFFDELDALCPRRSGHGEGGSSVRVVNQLLTEMDGLEARKEVFIMGATNRPDIIDPAVLRPGRLDKLLYVGLPTPEDRLDILNTITKNGTKPCLAEGVDLKMVAEDEKCQHFTGADLAALVREAAVSALREFMSQPTSSEQTIAIDTRHFHTAFSKVKPSVSLQDQKIYERIKSRSAT